MTDVSNTLTIVAPVKWFNTTKGYGFLEHPELKDVFLHKSVITRKFRGWFLPSGHVHMKVRVFKDTKGWAVFEVLDPDYTEAKEKAE